jgi:hypothetical protein
MASLTDILHFNTDTFTAIMKENLSQEKPLSAISNPLSLLDFPKDDRFAKDFIHSLDTIVLNTACGFHSLDTPLHPNVPLNHKQ